MNSNQKISERRYYPMIVSESGGEAGLSPDEDRMIWERFDRLSSKAQDILTAREMPFKMRDLQSQFQLQDSLIGMVSLLVRKIFFGEMNLAQVEAKIGSLLIQNGGDPNKARDIVQFIDQEIVHMVPKPVVSQSKTTESEPSIVRSPLLQAMGKFPRLGEQNITEGRIRIKMQSEPVRGSLANWIRYYRDELGIGFHDEVLRGKFLFQSENGKRVTSSEREHLNLILKSIEEDFPLEIDTQHQTIMFPATEGKSMELGSQRDARSFSSQASLPPRTQTFTGNSGDGSMLAGKPTPSFSSRPSFFADKQATPDKNIADKTLHFSTGHVLPAEKDSVKNNLPPRPTMAEQAARAIASVPLSPKTQETGLSAQNAGEARISRAAGEMNRGASLRSPYSIRPLRTRNDE